MKQRPSPRSMTLVMGAALLAGLALSVGAPGSARGRIALQMEAEKGIVPQNKADLFQFLQAGEYKTFARESGIHDSEGPHGKVLTYVNPILEASLKAESEAHPVNAACVKELYDGNNRLIGWSVSVKTQDDSNEGKGWYWYEVFSTTENRPIADGKGVGLCVGCHAAGRDYVRIPYPLP